MPTAGEVIGQHNGRPVFQRRQRRVCFNGHAMTDENTVLIQRRNDKRGNGWVRACRICDREKRKRYQRTDAYKTRNAERMQRKRLRRSLQAAIALLRDHGVVVEIPMGLLS